MLAKVPSEVAQEVFGSAMCEISELYAFMFPKTPCHEMCLIAFLNSSKDLLSPVLAEQFPDLSENKIWSTQSPSRIDEWMEREIAKVGLNVHVEPATL